MTNKIDIPSKVEEVRLVYQSKTRANERPKVSSPKEAFNILMKAWDMDQIELLEECKVLLLDRSLRLMSVASISKGGVAGTFVDPKIIFAMALKRRATGIILAHNHPSGNLKPSSVDIQLTRKFRAAGMILDIKVEDHLIVTPDRQYTSLVCDGFV
ncbi:MAG: JAB domain-containing protein [Cyclobacteriaceae bacterium]